MQVVAYPSTSPQVFNLKFENLLICKIQPDCILPELKYGRTQIHTITYETLFNILSKVFHGFDRMTTIERTKPTITHASMIYHVDRLLRAGLISADKKGNLSLTERGQKCLRAFQDIESYLNYDTAFAPPYEVKLLSRAHFEHLYDDGIMHWKPPKKRRPH